MTHTVNDTITLEALGPNNVVIYRAKNFHSHSAPDKPFPEFGHAAADSGAVTGLNIVVHDPFDLDLGFTSIIDRAYGFFGSVVDKFKAGLKYGGKFLLSLIRPFLNNPSATTVGNLSLDAAFTIKFEGEVFKIILMSLSITSALGPMIVMSQRPMALSFERLKAMSSV